MKVELDDVLKVLYDERNQYASGHWVCSDQDRGYAIFLLEILITKMRGLSE